MTIKALEHIHHLLQVEVNTGTELERSRRVILEAEYDKKLNGESNEYDTALASWTQANELLKEWKDTLEEFEFEDWK